MPFSAALCRRLAAHTRATAGQIVVELGAGTGVVSRALIADGLPPERLSVVEIVPGMAASLRRVLPGTQVIDGDARRLPRLITRELNGCIGTRQHPAGPPADRRAAPVH